MTAIDDLGWPARRLGDALEAVAVRSGLTAAGASAAAPRGDTGDVRDPGRRLADLAAALGVEVEHVETPYARIEALLRAIIDPMAHIRRLAHQIRRQGAPAFASQLAPEACEPPSLRRALALVTDTATPLFSLRPDSPRTDSS